MTGRATLICGANAQELEVAGMTLTDARQQASQVLNIPPEAKAINAGNDLPDDHVITENEQIEFVKPADVKG